MQISKTWMMSSCFFLLCRISNQPQNTVHPVWKFLPKGSHSPCNETTHTVPLFCVRKTLTLCGTKTMCLCSHNTSHITLALGNLMIFLALPLHQDTAIHSATSPLGPCLHTWWIHSTQFLEGPFLKWSQRLLFLLSWQQFSWPLRSCRQMWQIVDEAAELASEKEICLCLHIWND